MATAKPELPGQMLALEEHKQGRKRPRSSSGSSDMPRNEAAQKAGPGGLEDAPDTLRSRGYQIEMLDASIKQNIIVAMDTGSGKTQMSVNYTHAETLSYDHLNNQASSNTVGHIYSAILRIRHELERCSNDKLVWFLAPKVPLAEQQYRAISQQLPAYQTKILTGADNLERWSTQKIWDAFLLNTRIVVSTPQILLDVLSNGFITLRRIALLVFDEAHHCVKASPENKIMKNFYHARIDQLSETNDLPSILGLTASPTSKLTEDSLRQLEQNLHACCKTPSFHREEMMQYVHIPELLKISYQKDSTIPHNMEMKFLSMLNDIDIESDPFFQRYKGKTDRKSIERFMRARDRKTPCLDQLKRCFTRVSHIYGELGHWASSTFISEIYRRTREKRAKLIDQSWSEWDRDDSSFLCNALKPVVAIIGERCWNSTPDAVSQKVEHLVDLLASELTGTSRGIIFVEQRATAVMLSHLISHYPELAHIMPDYFLGNSAFSDRKADITELSKPGDMKNSIDDLKSGKKNLLVATSVLEEGIDVSACDLVVCFDPPKQLRSFVQRRGRARKQSSKFVIFYAEDDTATHKDWEAMEDIMKERYFNNKEFIDRLREEDDEEDVEYESLRIESTGALLTLENARSHLSHFCSTLPCEFTDTQPDFIISNSGIKDMLTAKVLLPTVLDLQFREFEGIQAWKREKMAKRDAAFQAYLQLYKAGLVNDHLMPEHCRTTDEETAHIEKRTSMTTCSEVFNPWKMVADRWHSTDTFYQSSIVISSGTEELPRMLLILPIPLPCGFTVKLFWNETSTLSASVSPQELTVSEEDIVSAPLATHILLSSVFPSRMNGTSRDFSCIFVPDLAKGHGGLESWCTKVSESILGRNLESGGLGSIGDFGLARRTDIYARAWVAERFVWMKPVRAQDDSESAEDDEEEEEILHVEGEKWPKRADFLHPVANSTDSKPHHTARNCIPARQSCISMLPVGFAKFALFIPSLIHTIGRYLLAEELSQTILSPVGFQNIQLVLTAITATSAREDTNYQRLEFLGDSALKLHASMQLLAEHPLWHEGILSKKKDSIVSNSRLWKAAVDTGLDQFILTTCFTGAKWRPLYNSTYADNAGKIGEKSTRELSTKTLADVVESLIGAAIIDGGENKVLRCLELFLPEINWQPSGERIEILFDSAPDFNDDCPRDIMSKIEPLIDYSFTKKALLATSLSHPSNLISRMTYQRLEFLGDSILDNIVTRALFRCKKEIPHQDMHLIRTALVNADFLAFLCMNTSTDVTREDVCVSPTGEVEVTSSTHQVSLWQYMSHSSTDIVETQQAIARTFEELRDQIEKALRSGASYPWTLLSTLNAPKFFSDIIESILGAIFIDSRGSILACQKFLARISLMDYLQRVLEEDGIDFMHPKQRLGVVAQSLSVKYVVSEVHVKPGVTQWKCQVLVGDEEISRVDDGVSQNQARAKAADLALEVLRMKN